MFASLVQYDKLQNGSDIRGVAIEGAGKEVNLSLEVAKFIAYGFIKLLENKRNTTAENLKVAVGMDPRLSGPALKTAIIEVLTDLGCNVYDCSIATTPAMFMTTVLENYKCDGSIMITASHLPYYYNGLKFFTREGGCEKEDIKNILEEASKEENNFSNSKGEVIKVNFIEEYSKILVDMIRSGADAKENYNEPLAGFKIIVDAGNGAGGFFAYKVLKVLGANIEGSQFTDPDGTFPNHIPNPENKEAMESIRKAVLTHEAHLGIIFDTDVDRAAIVAACGMEINKNALIALVSSIILEEHPNTVIVTDSVTSTGLTKFITDLGGVHHRFKRGYKNVINESKKLNEDGEESHLAIETSGHAALKENHFLDDGAYLIAKILIKMAKLKEERKEISSLIEALKHPEESEDIRLKIKREGFKAYGDIIISDIKEYVKTVEGLSIETNNYEGVKINCDKDSGDGWLLLRMSLHEPVLSLNVESESLGGVCKILEKIRPFIEKYKDLDLKVLEKYEVRR